MAEKVKRAAGIKVSNVVPISKRFDATTQRIFLAHLAETANVAASAREAGISASKAYSLRRKNDEFRDQWIDALAEGYVNLEALLLAEALEDAEGKTPDNILKERSQKHRLALALLAAHRSSVKARDAIKHTGSSSAISSREDLRKDLVARLDNMRSRAESRSAE